MCRHCGPPGLTVLKELDPSLPRHTAAGAYLHEREGDPATAAHLYAQAAEAAPNLAERSTSPGRPRGWVVRSGTAPANRLSSGGIS